MKDTRSGPTRDRKALTIWSPTLCKSIWATATREPTIDNNRGRERTWDYGVVTERRPRRSVRCAACGETMPAGELALYATRWIPALTAVSRFLHRAPCVGS